jgi:spore coat polysaccharide biosynthesis protein SpsF
MILAILQARTGSTRFPAKVLADLHGRPMVVRQVERLRRSAGIDRLVAALPSGAGDDELESVLAAEGVPVFRGPRDDVLGRFAIVAEAEGPDHIVRLTADCPLTDPAVVDTVIAEHLRTGADLTVNTMPPTYPDGLDAEVMEIGAFRRLHDLGAALSAVDREHVTYGMHARPEHFRVHNVTQHPDRSALRWTVDLPADLAFANAVYARLYDENPAFGQQDVLDLLDEEPSLARTERDEPRNAGLRAEEGS